jgi:ERCC4-related helicase
MCKPQALGPCRRLPCRLICSDLIARGIDLPSVEHVVSYDIPLDMRKYVHRVGRTARAGRDGTAWTLVEKQEVSAGVWFVDGADTRRRCTSRACSRARDTRRR